MPDFPLKTFAREVREHAAITTAFKTVEGQPYFMLYATQTEKNGVKSNGYKNSAFISMKLLIKSLGEICRPRQLCRPRKLIRPTPQE